MTWQLVLILFLVLGAEFVNGWTDAPNAIATVVSTRVMPIRVAVVMATLLNIVGALSGTAVAFTIGRGIVDASMLEPGVIAAAMISLILWSTLAAQFGIPTSESHALVAGLAGAALAVAGPEVLLFSGWAKVGIGLLLSTGVGFAGSLLLAKLVIQVANHLPAQLSRKLFGRLQILSSMFMAYNHGLNDGQKFIGVFAMTLVMGGILPKFSTPIWVILLCSITMGIGTSIGGLKIIRQVGMRMVDIRPWQGFAAESSAALVIWGASLSGVPLSTTHTITTSIIGVAAAKSFKGSVRWRIVADIVLAWVVTFPLCGTLSFLIALLFKHLT
ncbi:MAG: inorganic phosphate transporter [Candidatus Lindowbacteria bacterium]|nr:inorganic phosphate transporter [Candidatus Lindowbacteria bacterium]